MATIENTLARPEHNLLTRRAALRGTAAAGTMVLPAGAALAAARRTDSLADDPGLARLEAG